MTEIIPPVDKALLQKELTSEFFVRPTNKAGNEIYDITADRCPSVMREIARLREVTYRHAGGSKGEALDIDDMDTMPKPYHQLIVWNPDEQEIVGGYRYLDLGECVFSESGQPYITSSFLFHYSERFISEFLPHTIELGRAFVQPRYQSREAGAKAIFALDNLWDGLGAIIYNLGHAKYLIGKVTIYHDYNSLARNLIYAYMERHCRYNSGLFEPYEPIGISREAQDMADAIFNSGDALADMQNLKKAVRDCGSVIPPMFSAYLNLTDRLQYFGTAMEATFSNVYDSGIMIALDDVYQEKKERYIGSYLEWKATADNNC